MKHFNFFILTSLLVSFIINPLLANATPLPPKNLSEKRIILFVWDGLRPDAVTNKNTPNLYALMKRGVQFKDNHSSFPTFTMMNAASFATGDFAGKTGFFGNTLWHPGVKGVGSSGKIIDFQQPVFTEDYKLLQDLDEDQLLLAKTLLQAAHQKGLRTAVVGKSGPAFLQDYRSQGIILDEKHVYPLSFAKQLQQDGYAIPKLAPLAFKHGALKLAANNGDPTTAGPIIFMKDGVTGNPTDHRGSPYSKANEYMMNIYLHEILPREKPQLSIVWMRNPDTTEHDYGPGTPNYFEALKSNDQMLGSLEYGLAQLKMNQATDIIVVSDHAHSHVSASLSQFPLRSIHQGRVSQINTDGYSVSGEIRTADLLTKAGFHAYDGEGCRYDPVLSGIKKNGKPLYKTLIDQSGAICGTAGQKYITPAYHVPEKNMLPKNAIIVAADGNGGSEYFYVPSHNKKLVQQLIIFMQSREPYGAIFSNARYGIINGTIPMSTVKIQNAMRSPDVIASLNYDEHAVINGLPGIEFSDSPNERGMHGSFSPIDVHNSLFAIGPDFRHQFKDNLPTGNVDVAPTIAHILKLNLPNTDGRVLFEGFRSASIKNIFVKNISIAPLKPAQGLNMLNALNQPISTHSYTIHLQVKILTQDGYSYSYFDYAKAIRK